MARAVVANPNTLSPVVTRLEDAHRLWHQADEAYFDPDGFRVAVQGMLQTLRSVTFILQKQKSNIPSFDAWYAPWQERLRADPLMRWTVDARNRIEKEGDLEAKSFVRAELIVSYLDSGPSVEVPAELFQSPIQLIRSVPPDVFRAHVAKHGSLRIQRRWIENSLPDYELLDGMAIAYGRIAELVNSAHQQLGLPVPPLRHEEGGPAFDLRSMGWRMPCMIGHSEMRSMVISLDDASIRTMTKETIPATEKSMSKAGKRYGGAGLTELAKLTSSDTLEDLARATFKMTRTVFLKDKYHQSMVILVKDKKPVRLMATPAANQADKYLLMREVAHEVTRYGADALMIIGEVWVAAAHQLRPYERPGEIKERGEALALLLDSRDGAPFRLSATIQRKGLRGRKVSLASTEETQGGSAYIIAPIYRAWGKEIPEDWQRQEEKLMALAKKD